MQWISFIIPCQDIIFMRSQVSSLSFAGMQSPNGGYGSWSSSVTSGDHWDWASLCQCEAVSRYHEEKAATCQAWGSEQTNQSEEGNNIYQHIKQKLLISSSLSFAYCNSRIFMSLDMFMLLKGQEDPVEDSSTPKNFSKNPNKNMASQSNRKAKRQTCLDSKLICCITTKTVAQPPLALTLHLFPTEVMSLDTPDSSFQVSQSQLRLTKQCVFMVSPMTCMEVGICTISLSISETLDLLVLFPCSHQTGEVILGYYY